MVLSTSSSCNQDRLPGARQAPLKRRRSLSQFYFAKSQSFNCMSDLLKQSAFSQSSLLLAKRSSSSNGYEHSFQSISEDMSECTSPRAPCTTGTAAVQVPLVQQQLQSPFAGCLCLGRHSWDGSSRCRCSPDLYSSLQGTLSSPYEHQQQPQLQPGCDVDAQRLHTGSFGSSSDSGITAETAEAQHTCWRDEDSTAADSLSLALQTTSLAAAAAAVTTPSSLLGMSGSYSVSGGFSAAVGSPAGFLLVGARGLA